MNPEESVGDRRDSFRIFDQRELLLIDGSEPHFVVRASDQNADIPLL